MSTQQRRKKAQQVQTLDEDALRFARVLQAIQFLANKIIRVRTSKPSPVCDACPLLRAAEDVIKELDEYLDYIKTRQVQMQTQQQQHEEQESSSSTETETSSTSS